MNAKSRESRRRSIAKEVSWRLLGSLDTLVLFYLFSGSIAVAGSIASTEAFTKIVRHCQLGAGLGGEGRDG